MVAPSYTTEAARIVKRGLSPPPLVDGMIRAVVLVRNYGGVTTGTPCSTTRIVLSELGFLMVDILDVYAPHIMMRAEGNVLSGQHGSEHRVILIVVPVHAVAADWMNVGDALIQPVHDPRNGEKMEWSVELTGSPDTMGNWLKRAQFDWVILSGKSDHDLISAQRCG